MTINFTIPLIPRTKKNSPRIFTGKGKTVVLPSEAYTVFEKASGYHIGAHRFMNISSPVNVKAVFYMDKRKKVDLVNLLEAIDDILVKYKVISDDCRDIVAAHDGSRVYHDPEHPRIEVTITPLLEEYRQWGEKYKQRPAK